MRADARKNRDHLLAVARTAIAEQGAEASLRDIARRADVGLGTLYRHFPTREALLEALLGAEMDALSRRASELEASKSADDALINWFEDALIFTRAYSGVVALMAAALEDVSSALHSSCSEVRSAGARLLERAQVAGSARRDLEGVDLIAMIGALAWVCDQPAFAARADHLSGLMTALIFSAGDERFAMRKSEAT